jgi:hypothetical protein
MLSHRRPKGTFDAWPARLPLIVAAVLALVALATSSAVSASADPGATASATKLCNVKKQLPNGRVVTVYKTKIIKVKVRGKTVRKRVPLTKIVKRGGKKVRVKVPKQAACSKTKLCIVKSKAGKTVYLTKLARVKVIRRNKIVTVKKRVFVYKTVIKKVRGKKKRVKVKVAKLGKCSGKNSTTNSGVPVKITVVPPSMAHLDFGGFQRDIPLSGQLQGFIVGSGFKLGEDNRIELSRGQIDLAPTGIFIDDVCNGRVTDAIRTDPHSYAEIDQGTTGNAVNVAANSTVTGRLHFRIVTALQLRNDDGGCDSPYITTGWTDFQVPLFVKGTLGAGNGGLQSKLTTGETVLNDLSACLAPGNPELPCNGFAIPFPAIFTSTIVAQVKVG